MVKLTVDSQSQRDLSHLKYKTVAILTDLCAWFKKKKKKEEKCKGKIIIVIIIMIIVYWKFHECKGAPAICILTQCILFHIKQL